MQRLAESVAPCSKMRAVLSARMPGHGDEPMPAAVASPDRTRLLEQFRSVRAATESLCRRLSPEDCNLQSMKDASPPKWHLAHSTWFFETFILATTPGYEPFDPAFNFLFNSYYDAIGARHPRPKRGLLSRPSIAEVYRFRAIIDGRMTRFLESADVEQLTTIKPLLELGLNHEQQHQELILTDILHAFSLNPLQPAYSVEQRNRMAPAAGVAVGSISNLQ